jgi:hypothetical protein
MTALIVGVVIALLVVVLVTRAVRIVPQSHAASTRSPAASRRSSS